MIFFTNPIFLDQKEFNARKFHFKLHSTTLLDLLIRYNRGKWIFIHLNLEEAKVTCHGFSSNK